MPLYEYECSACKKRFELIQKYSDEPTNVCLKCGGPAHRLLSSPAIQFKGTGWYVTDYGKGSGGASDVKSSDGASTTETKTEVASPAKESTSKPAETSTKTE